FGVTNALHTCTKDWRMSNNRHFHSRQIEVESEFQRAITLRTAIESFDSFAHEPELRRILQTNSCRYWFARRLTGEFSVSCRLAVWTMYHARFCATFIRSGFPTIGRSRNEHRASLCTQLTILLIRMRNRTRPANDLGSEK